MPEGASKPEGEGLIPKFRLDDPLFIAAMVAAVMGDNIMLGGAVLGVGLLPLAGLGLVPLVLALILRQIIAVSLLGYVLVAMKSPRSLLADISSTVIEPEFGWIFLIFRPWVIMLLAIPLFFFPFAMSIALILSAIAQNAAINKILDFAQNITSLGGTALVKAGEKQLVKGAEKEALKETEKVAEKAGEKTLAAGGERVVEAGEGVEGAARPGAGGGSREITEEDFGMPKESPVEAAMEEEFAEPVTETDFRKKRRGLEDNRFREEGESESPEEGEENEEDEELERRANLGDVEKRKILESLENIPDVAPYQAAEDKDTEEGETVDLRKAA